MRDDEITLAIFEGKGWRVHGDEPRPNLAEQGSCAWLLGWDGDLGPTASGSGDKITRTTLDE